MSDGPQERRNIEAIFRLEGMADDIGEMKIAMRDMAHAVAKMALVEERQAHDRQDISRAFSALDDHEGRIKSIEITQPSQTKTTDWVDRALWVMINAVMVAIISLVVFGARYGQTPDRQPTAATAPAK